MNTRPIEIWADQIIPIAGIPLFKQRELTTLLMTVGGESRGEPIAGIQAVANVIMNRYKQQRECFGYTIHEVCTKSVDGVAQFSCWCFSNPNRKWMQNPNVYEWQKIFEPTLKEYLGLAQFFAERNVCYYKRMDVEDYGFWNRLNHVERIGNHDFYSDPNLPSFST